MLQEKFDVLTHFTDEENDLIHEVFVSGRFDDSAIKIKTTQVVFLGPSSIFGSIVKRGSIYLMFCLWDLIWHFVTQCAIRTKGLISWFPNGVQGPFYTKRDFYKVIQQSYEPTIKRSTMEKYAICRRDYSAKNPTFLQFSFMWGHFLRDDITIFLLTNYVYLGNWWWVDLNFLRLLKKQVSW